MKRHIITLLLLSACRLAAVACGPFYRTYSADQYFTYRVCGDDMEGKGYSQAREDREENCQAWADITSRSVSTEDINEVVYRWNLGEMTAFRRQMGEHAAMKHENSFARWLAKHHDTEAVDFLILAKQCEQTRQESFSAWYYAVDGDEVSCRLQAVLDSVEHYAGRRLKDRYLLQALRALTTIKQYDRIISLWNENQNAFPQGVIRRMAVGYVAGAYENLDRKAEAKRLYMANNMYNEAYLYADPEDEPYNDRVMNKISWAARNGKKANVKPLLAELQKRIREIEWFTRWDFDEEYTSVRFRDVYQCLTKILKKRPFADMAPWDYTLAFLADKLGMKEQAWAHILRAEREVKQQEMSDVIQVLKMMVAVSRAKVYDMALEDQLFAHLKWLDKKIVDGLTAEKKEKVLRDIIEYHNCGYSLYYWDDMQRKLLIGRVAPLCQRSGYQTRALQYVNMADNRLLNLVDMIEWKEWGEDEDTGWWDIVSRKASVDEYRNADTNYNHYDYRNDLFINLMHESTGTMKRLIHRMEHPLSPLDRFLNQRSYTDKQYFYEILGTKYNAEMRYAEAERCFNKVSEKFNRSRNVSYCFGRDPFSKERKTVKKEHYKRNFSAEMARLERQMASMKDPNDKAETMLRYCRGLYNSVGSRCWCLTYYAWGTFTNHYFLCERNKTANAKIKERADRMVEQAMALFTDKERAAKALYEWDLYKTAVERYPDTETAAFIKGHCDNLYDYSQQFVPNWRLDGWE